MVYQAADNNFFQVCSISAANACGGMGYTFLFTVTLCRSFLGPFRLFKGVLTVTGASFPSLPLPLELLWY